MQEVENPTGSQIQTAAVDKTPAASAAPEAPKKADQFTETVANILSGTQALEQANATAAAAPKNPNEKSLVEILKSCQDENDFVTKVLSRKDGLNHLLLSDMNHLMEKLATEFPAYAKVSSIGKSFEGRDINMLEITAPDVGPGSQSLSMQPVEGSEQPSHPSKKPAIFMTGATHARELISSSINMYKAVKLIQEGVINKNPTYEQYLKDSKFYFVPALNVDGVALIEQNWEKDHKIIPVRKNRDTAGAQSLAQAPVEAQGVDLNRNFGVQFADSAGHPDFVEDKWIAKADKKDDDQSLMQMSASEEPTKDAKSIVSDPRSMFYTGKGPFSEPESQAYKNFLTQHQDEIKFVLNMHSNGNAFIWPFNGV
jgi:hypothetical protein